MLEVKNEHDEEHRGASQERMMPLARNAPMYQNQLIVRPFNKHIQGPENVSGFAQQFHQYWKKIPI